MAAVVDVGQVAPARAMRPGRWVLAARGVLWLLAAAAVLSYTSASVGVIAILAAGAILLGGVDELVEGVTAESWRWAHIALGVAFCLAGAVVLLLPWWTFGVLALFFGWYLVVKGIFDAVLAVVFRDIRPLWGLALAVGTSEVLLGMWVLVYPRRSPWLMVLWIGVGAALRGIGDLVRAISGRES